MLEIKWGGGNFFVIVLLVFFGGCKNPNKVVEMEEEIVVRDVCFSPQCNIKNYILEKVLSARSTLKIINFKFDNKEIADAILSAHNKGVDIQVLCDERSKFNMTDSNRNSYNFSVLDYLSVNNIDVRVIDIRPAILHQKMILVDGEIVSFGSANFYTDDLDNNYEVFTSIVGDSLTTKLFFDNFESHWACAESFTSLQKESVNIVSSDFELGDYSKSNLQELDRESTLLSIVFSPEYDMGDYIIRNIRTSTKRVFVVASIFREEKVFKELVRLANNGVEVMVLANAISPSFKADNIKIKKYNPIDEKSMMHSKVFLIDDSYVLCGSVNLFDRSMTEDIELLVKFRDEELYKIYYDNFYKLWNTETFNYID